MNTSIIKRIAETIRTTTQINPELFSLYNVKRGLRNEDNSGVVVGLTKIGDVIGYERDSDNNLHPIHGKLLYRGIDLADIVQGAQDDNRLGFEEVIFLLLSDVLPTKYELDEFSELLSDLMDVNPQTRMNILELEGQDIMNILARAVLELYVFDEKPNDIDYDNLVLQSLKLIAQFPTIIAYAYNALRYSNGKSLHIRHPHKGFSLAENFLYLMKGDEYTDLDVKILDLSLMVHADHGGGNNSTFAVRVTSSTSTDIYSAIASGIGSLKGPLHGGANLQVGAMLHHIKNNVDDWTNVEEIDSYLMKILHKEAYDKTGLIYGIGHAVYTLSDPRAVLLKEMARMLAEEKNKMDEFNFYSLLEERAIYNFTMYKGQASNKFVCANVDFYSGFIYEMLGLPKEIFTPLFAMSRVVGWCAHRIEELNFKEKRIIRPAYKYAGELKAYLSLKDRV